MDFGDEVKMLAYLNLYDDNFLEDLNRNIKKKKNIAVSHIPQFGDAATRARRVQDFWTRTRFIEYFRTRTRFIEYFRTRTRLIKIVRSGPGSG
jgi:hypothetical protein